MINQEGNFGGDCLIASLESILTLSMKKLLITNRFSTMALIGFMAYLIGDYCPISDALFIF